MKPLALQKKQHRDEVQILPHKRVFDLRERVVHFGCAQAHLKRKKLTCSAERGKKDRDKKTDDESDHRFSRK